MPRKKKQPQTLEELRDMLMTELADMGFGRRMYPHYDSAGNESLRSPSLDHRLKAIERLVRLREMQMEESGTGDRLGELIDALKGGEETCGLLQNSGS